ncbi:MAG: TolC family protein [Gammaproteobacteria bacterium]|nr:TolC family protein [Gammaproteobacteria bacterium]
MSKSQAQRRRLPYRSVLAVTAALVLTGCATFSEDGGFGAVQSMAKERLGSEAKWLRNEADADAADRQVQALLAKPLSAEDAVQIALLNNRGLQASYAELGIAEADLVQAGRIANPTFGYFNVRGGGELNIERALSFNVIQLLTMPLATKITARRFEQTKLAVSAEMLGVAAESRRAYYGAVAAQESIRYFEQVKESAEAGAELARRMFASGNYNVLQRAREQAFYADAVAQLARARQTAVAERERLTRLMGLWGKDVAFRLPDRLPELPKGPAERQDAEQTAMSTRLDVQASRRDLEALAESLGLTKATRFINVLEIGIAQERDQVAVLNGYEIRLEIPIFDWGEARVARAEALYMQAANRTAETAVNARSEVREAYSAYRTTYDLARHYRNEIVPLRKKISEENLLRYNGMLIGVFELLADARESIAAVNASIEAQRDFWLADTNLQAAQNGAVAGMRKAAGGPAMAAAEPRNTD